MREKIFNDGWVFQRGVSAGAEAPGFVDSAWRAVKTPHDWRIEDLPNPTAADGGSTAEPAAWAVPANPPARIGPFDSTATDAGRAEAWTIGGEGWYRKHFTVAGLSAGDIVSLHFDGVYHNSDVWLNGEHLGFYPYGYSPFEYDLTPYLNATGDNVLAVKVSVEAPSSRWYPGAGIFRNVTLVTTRAVHIDTDGIYATSHDISNSKATISVNTDVVNSSASDAVVQIRTTLLNKFGRQAAVGTTVAVTVAAGATATPRVDLTISQPDLWSIDSPTLYTVRSEVLVGQNVVDRAEVSTGIRSLSITGASGFLLNGKEVKMRGGNIHHDNGALGAVAHPDAEDRKIKTLKASGFNAIRTSHNPPSAALLAACDKYGVVVIDEFFDRWDNAVGTFGGYFEAWWQRIVTSVVRRDRNHPSIVIWSTGNEIGRPPADGTQLPQNAKYGKALADFVRSLDTTRPVTQGSAMGQAFFFSLAGTAPDWSYLDLADVHYQNDLETPSHKSSLPLHEGHPDFPLVVGEAWVQELYDDWQSVLDHKWAIGTFSWTGWDYLGESGAGVPRLIPAGSPLPGLSLPQEPYPWISSYQGDHDLIGTPKPQLYWKRVVWGLSDLEMAVERPAPDGFEQATIGWSYYDELQSWTWPGQEGKSMKVRVYTTGDSVSLQLNGKVIGTKAMTAVDKRVTTFVVPYAAGKLTATATRARKGLGSKNFVTAGAPVGIRLTSDNRRFSAVDQLAHVLIEIVDRAGNIVPDAVNKVTLTLAGSAVLAGIGSANPHYVDSYQQPRRYTYHGQALAVLRSTAASGGVTLNVAGEGLAGAVIRL